MDVVMSQFWSEVWMTHHVMSEESRYRDQHMSISIEVFLNAKMVYNMYKELSKQPKKRPSKYKLPLLYAQHPTTLTMQ